VNEARNVLAFITREAVPPTPSNDKLSGAASTAAAAAHVTVTPQLPRASSICCCKVLLREWLQVSAQNDDMVLQRASGLRAIDVLKRIA
jgi:hypothetical protein